MLKKCCLSTENCQKLSKIFFRHHVYIIPVFSVVYIKREVTNITIWWFDFARRGGVLSRRGYYAERVLWRKEWFRKGLV